MQTNHIKVPLGLPETTVIRQEISPGGALRVVVRRTTEQERCPRCGHVATKRHDVRQRAKADVPIGDHAVTLVVLRRRFRCFTCRRPFSEPEPICGPRRRLTCRLRERLGQECRDRPVEHLAQEFGVSPTTVRRARREVVARQQEQAGSAPPILGIDEFSVRKGQRYATGLHDITGRRVLDVIKGRTQEKVQEALERLSPPERVRVVSMDLAGNFRAAVQEVLPDALIVADKFHVVKRVNKAVWQVWRRLLRGTPKDDPLRTDGALALRAYEQLAAPQRASLDVLLRAYPLLQRAHRLKEDFRHWYRRCSAKDARLELSAWRRMVTDLPDLPEFAALAGMFEGWQEEILNYFTHPVTQGFVEGKNNLAKALERRAFGYRNVDNLRDQLLLAN
jgi:transposase